MAPQSHDFEESAAATRGIVMADGRRDLVDGRLRKLQQFPSAGHSKALNGRLTYGCFWLSADDDTYRDCAQLQYIFGALQSNMERKRQFAPNKVLVLYC
jgi:hypothetical protein